MTNRSRLCGILLALLAANVAFDQEAMALKDPTWNLADSALTLTATIDTIDTFTIATIDEGPTVSFPANGDTLLIVQRGDLNFVVARGPDSTWTVAGDMDADQAARSFVVTLSLYLEYERERAEPRWWR